MMEPCPYISWIGAYHDGELPDDRKALVERHLSECGQCQAEREGLRRLSSVLASMSSPTLPRIASRRLHAQVDALTERNLLRFAELLSGVAAAVLILASAWMARTTEVAAEPLPTWQRAALTLQPEPAGEVSPLHTVRWMVTEISPGQSND